MKVTGSTIQQLDKLRKNGSKMPKSECRRWRLWVTTEEGRKSKRFNGTYSEARKALDAWVDELEGIVPNRETFGSYAETWRKWREESGNFSPNTVYADETALNAIKRTKLAEMRMDAITPEICREELLWLKSNPVNCESYSANTVAAFHKLLSSVFKQAVEDGKLASNPMKSVMGPKVEKSSRTALSPGELLLFLKRVDEELPLDGKSVALYLMACLGLRCGEACALKDSELSDGFATITSTVRGADGSVGPPKSRAGMRKLPVPSLLQEKVDEWREARKALGFEDAETLCCNSKGALLTTNTLRVWWEKKRGGMGCEGMVLHELRHSNLSMMARHLSVFDLQRYAGWATIAPARIYVHEDMDAVTRAVEGAWDNRAHRKRTIYDDAAL